MGGAAAHPITSPKEHLRRDLCLRPTQRSQPFRIGRGISDPFDPRPGSASGQQPGQFHEAVRLRIRIVGGENPRRLRGPGFRRPGQARAAVADEGGEGAGPGPTVHRQGPGRSRAGVNAIGALIDRTDPGIPPVLLGSVFAQIAVSAHHLNGEIGRVNSRLRADIFADRRHELNEVMLAAKLVRDKRDVAQGAGPDGECIAGVDHARDIGMPVDGHDLARPALSLPALGRVATREVSGTGGMSDALQGDVESGVIHHREHRLQPAAFFTDKRTARVIERELTGWRGVKTQLFLDTRDADCIAAPIGKIRQTGKKRQAANACLSRPRAGEIVLDGFGGSGSTLIAAEKTGRRGFLVELDPIYCDRILARWEAYAKDAAERLVCGWPHAAERLEAAE
jgi:hypothetical protein